MSIERDYSLLNPEELRAKLKEFFSQVPMNPSVSEAANVKLTPAEEQHARDFRILDTSEMIRNLSQFDVGNATRDKVEQTEIKEVQPEEVPIEIRTEMEAVVRHFAAMRKIGGERTGSNQIIDRTIELERLLEQSPAIDSLKRLVIYIYRERFVRGTSDPNQQDISEWFLSNTADLFVDKDCEELEIEGFRHVVNLSLQVRGGSGIGTEYDDQAKKELEQLGRPNYKLSFLHELIVTYRQEFFDKYGKEPK